MALKLPRPDIYGNYWFGGSPKAGVAILPFKELHGKTGVTETGEYTVLVSSERGFLMDGEGKRIKFKSVELALAALAAAQRGG